eukprot:6464668-Amphidinium_carterae.2
MAKFPSIAQQVIVPGAFSLLRQRVYGKFGPFEAKPPEAAVDAVFDSFNSGTNFVDAYDKMNGVVTSWYADDGSLSADAVRRIT